MDDHDIINGTLQRIEEKLDTVVIAHAERIAKVEVRVESIEKAETRAEIKGWVKSGITAIGAVASHIGLTKLGVKI